MTDQDPTEYISACAMHTENLILRRMERICNLPVVHYDEKSNFYYIAEPYNLLVKVMPTTIEIIEFDEMVSLSRLPAISITKIWLERILAYAALQTTMATQRRKILHHL